MLSSTFMLDKQNDSVLNMREIIPEEKAWTRSHSETLQEAPGFAADIEKSCRITKLYHVQIRASDFIRCAEGSLLFRFLPVFQKFSGSGSLLASRFCRARASPISRIVRVSRSITGLTVLDLLSPSLTSR